jgi:uncharacterized membrane protein YfcA
MSLGDAALLLVAGAGAGSVNAVAGGGSLLSFPALLATGYSPVTANVTNALAVLPGYLGGSLAYREELRGQRGRAMRLGVSGALGGAAGAIVLLSTPASAFEAIVPFLVAGASLLLLAQPWLERRLGSRGDGEGRSAGVHIAQFAAAVYGGYFGAGLGIILLAFHGLLLGGDLQRLNALKGILSLIVSIAAAAVFVVAGPIAWGAAALVAASAFAGGHLGVSVARRLSPEILRWGVAAVGIAAAVVLLVT